MFVDKSGVFNRFLPVFCKSFPQRIQLSTKFAAVNAPSTGDCGRVIHSKKTVFQRLHEKKPLFAGGRRSKITVVIHIFYFDGVDNPLLSTNRVDNRPVLGVCIIL